MYLYYIQLLRWSLLFMLLICFLSLLLGVWMGRVDEVANLLFSFLLFLNNSVGFFVGRGSCYTHTFYGFKFSFFSFSSSGCLTKAKEPSLPLLFSHIWEGEDSCLSQKQKRGNEIQTALSRI